MISLDNISAYPTIDQQNMLEHLEDLPQQLVKGWKLGLMQPLSNIHPPAKIIIAGMGGSAIGADLVSAYVESTCPVPVFVQRDYGLPAWANGKDTLVIASSHSGNTEETISVFEEAIKRGCQTLLISKGGRLAELAGVFGTPWWKFEHNGQPRSAAGWTFGQLLALFHQLGFAPDASNAIQAAHDAMIAQQDRINPQVALIKNAAKRQAGQLMGRWVCVVGSGLLAPVARRWKGQINELAKAWGQFEFLPEIDHNTLAGTIFPAEMMDKLVVLFLRAGSEHERNGLRSELTRQEFIQQGIGTDNYTAMGNTPMEHMWTAIQFGDYLAYYLALLYEVDPTPITAMESLKVALRK